MKKPEKLRWRFGDRVRIKVPKFVLRVGYPKSFDDYSALVPKFTEEIDELLHRMLGKESETAVNVFGKKYHLGPMLLSEKHRLRMALAYTLAGMDGFGGRERTIHFIELPKHAGVETHITDVRTALTGRYYPPSGGYRGMFEESDYEPGGLANEQRHRIAMLDLPRHLLEHDPFGCNSKWLDLEVPIDHLEHLGHDESFTRPSYFRPIKPSRRRQREPEMIL